VLDANTKPPGDKGVWATVGPGEVNVGPGAAALVGPGVVAMLGDVVALVVHPTSVSPQMIITASVRVLMSVRPSL
jgi:hypothetical protein